MKHIKTKQDRSLRFHYASAPQLCSKQDFNYIILFALLICSQCSNKLGKRVQYDKQLNHPFFHEEKWSYPSFTLKDSDGTFYSGFSDEADTSHLYHTSEIRLTYQHPSQMRRKNNADTIQYAKAFYAHDTLIVEFSALTPSSYAYLKIAINKETFTSSYSGGYPQVQDYSFDKQALTLRQAVLNPGDTLYGYLNFIASRPRYLHLEGYFKAPLVAAKGAVE